MIDHSTSPSLNQGVGEGIDEKLRSWGLEYLIGARAAATPAVMATARPEAKAAIASGASVDLLEIPPFPKRGRV